MRQLTPAYSPWDERLSHTCGRPRQMVGPFAQGTSIPAEAESAWISAIAPASAMGSRGSVFPECRGTFFFGDLYGACLSRLVLDGKRMQRPAGDHDHMVRLVPAL
jgi:hypothetical protein